MNKYKLLIFDVDGTLTDTDKMLIETYKTLYSIYRPNYLYTEEHIKTFSGPPIMETLEKEFPDEDPNFMLSEYKKYSRPNYIKYVTAFDNTREVLLKLKENGYILTIATSKMHQATLFTLDLINLNDIFDFFLASDDLIKVKPDRECVDKIREKYNVSQNETLFIGDTKYDVYTAKNAGVDCLIMTFKNRALPDDATPKYFASSMGDLYNKLK